MTVLATPFATAGVRCDDSCYIQFSPAPMCRAKGLSLDEAILTDANGP
jgi:hypothetical protein